MEMENVSSHLGDTTGYFDRVSERKLVWPALLSLARQRRWYKDDGCWAPCLHCFTNSRVMHYQCHFDPIKEINQVCLASSLPLDCFLHGLT